MTELEDDEKIVDSTELPYGGSYYKASLLGDRESERKIIAYRASSDIRPSLPNVKISDDRCEIEIIHLNKYGTIDYNLCLIKNKFILSNRQYLNKLSVYDFNNVYYTNIEIIKSGKILAIPIFDKPSIYYLIKKKDYDNDTIDTYYSIYTNLYWNRYDRSTSLPYSMFLKMSIDEITETIMQINES